MNRIQLAIFSPVVLTSEAVYLLLVTFSAYT